MNYEHIERLATFLRYWALRMSTKAGSGHPSSGLSAADLMATLWTTTFRFDFKNPDNPNNDRLIFSKGHATPLYYGLFAAAGAIKPEELDNYRQFESVLEGHPTPRFRFTEAATGSLGQGLSIGVGIALALRAKLRTQNSVLSTKNLQLTTHNSQPHVYVLLGDGEMAEGSTWEAIGIASKYKLINLVAILDVNRLGQSEETMLGWDLGSYQRRFEAFGWNTVVIDGHNFSQITQSFKDSKLQRGKGKPFVIIAKTVKGKGISVLENEHGWHGKPLTQEQFDQSIKELGKVDFEFRVNVRKPEFSQRTLLLKSPKTLKSLKKLDYKKGEEIAPRKAYGKALARIGEVYPNLVSLDADVKNSTYSEIFKEKFPDRFFEMYIAEQNMVGSAVGFARMGFIPFVSTFACFLTRAFDQIRMAAISGANIKFCGSHAGVSIGEDGPSQMGLEDLVMFRTINGSVVLYPADAVATEKLVEEMAKLKGISYIRTTRPPTPVIYGNEEKFEIGGSKVHLTKNQEPRTKNPENRTKNRKKSSITSSKSKVIIVAAGITLYEALVAQEELGKKGIEATVVDCYSIKPIDEKTLLNLTQQGPTQRPIVITVEDHWFEGGLGDAVLNVFACPSKPWQSGADDPKVRVYKLAVSKMPRSGKPEELLRYEGIDAHSIVKKAMEVVTR